jgi:hypothetical protein
MTECLIGGTLSYVKVMANLIITDLFSTDTPDTLYYINRAIEHLNNEDGGHRTFEISKRQVEQ